MRKLIVGIALAVALGSYLAACKTSATPAGGDSTAVVDTLKDSTSVDSVEIDNRKTINE